MPKLRLWPFIVRKRWVSFKPSCPDNKESNFVGRNGLERPAPPSPIRFAYFPAAGSKDFGKGRGSRGRKLASRIRSLLGAFRISEWQPMARLLGNEVAELGCSGYSGGVDYRRNKFRDP